MGTKIKGMVVYNYLELRFGSPRIRDEIDELKFIGNQSKSGTPSLGRHIFYYVIVDLFMVFVFY